MPNLIFKGKAARQKQPGGWVAPQSIAGGCEGVSTGSRSGCLRICMAQASGISGLRPPTVCWRLVIKCICAIYCDFLQGIGFTPTLWEFCAAVWSWVKWMLIFFLCSPLCVIAIARLGKEMVPELYEPLPREQRCGKSCCSASSLQAVNPRSYKILCECRCAVSPAYKRNVCKSGRTTFLSEMTYR